MCTVKLNFNEQSETNKKAAIEKLIFFRYYAHATQSFIKKKPTFVMQKSSKYLFTDLMKKITEVFI